MDVRADGDRARTIAGPPYEGYSEDPKLASYAGES
jgi:hypothetical protein